MADYNIYKNFGSSQGIQEMPIQTLPRSQKKEPWLKYNMDFFYNEAVKQKRQNLVFSKIRRMTEGDFVYESVDVESTLYGADAQHLNKLTADTAIPTHLKHFDFIGIIANAIESVFAEMDDKYRVISTDEYATNDFIRAKTENLHKYAEAVFKAEIDRMLIQNGVNPDRTEFKSEEEKQAYMQELDAQVKKYTPDEFEKTLSKNFKVLATEWANNTLQRDKVSFQLDSKDRDRLIDYILTGRWFRHYRLGYDNYHIEDWMPEQVFFSQKVDTKYPQKQDYIGRLTEMSITDALTSYGHLMTTKQQEEIGNFFNQSKDYKKGVYPFIGATEEPGLPFATNFIMPFENYFDHNVNLQMENFLGAPLAQTADKDTGEVTRHWMPRAGSMQAGLGVGFSQNYRNDIQVSNATIEVMEVYWTSFERTGVLIYRNEVGNLDIHQVSEEIMKDFITDNDIKVKRNISIEDMQKVLREGNLEEYENTISWHFKPQSWYAVVLKHKNNIVLKDDIILWGKPIERQIRGNSDYYEIFHPVGGIITKSKMARVFPYQQLHNICLNQISELLADEPGTFYTFDINTIPDELKEGTTEEALFNIMDTIKLTKLLPVNLSRQNLQGNTAYPNVFQKNEVVFAAQVQYRREMAEYFKQQGFAQVGVTPQLLGAPINQETAEGVKQQAVATYGLINNLIDDFNTSKAMSNELHIAIAQIAEVNGKSNARFMQNTDGANIFIDILAEDGEYFALRKLSVHTAANSKDRPVVKMLQQMLLSDNTIQKDFNDIVEIVTNPHSLKLKQVSRQMRDRQDKANAEERQFQESQLDKQIQAERQNLMEERQHQVNLTNIKGEWAYKQSYLTALGRDSASTQEDNFEDIRKAYELNLKERGIEQDMNIRMQEIQRKMDMDEETKKVEMEKLKLKREELALKNRQISSQEYIATINKN